MNNMLIIHFDFEKKLSIKIRAQQGKAGHISYNFFYFDFIET
jgi:hypothetical protein